jgi:hypothetical protein
VERLLTDEKRKELVSLARNLFLLHEMAEYMRHQIKDYNFADSYKEDEIAQGIAKALADHFASVDPELKLLFTELLVFYEKARQWPQSLPVFRAYP